MYLAFFLFIAALFSTTLGEFGQYPFGQTSFSVSLTDLLLGLSLTAILIWNIGIKKDYKKPKNIYPLFAFWIIGFLSLLINSNFSGIFYLVRFIFYSSVFYLVYHFASSKILSRVELFKLIKFSSLILAGAGVFQLIFYPDLNIYAMYGYDPHKLRMFSTFLDPNFTAAFLSFGLLVSVYELLQDKYENLKEYLIVNRFNIFTSLILLASIILTYSRSGYLMLFSGLFILLASHKKLLLVPLFLVPVILFLIYPPFAQRIEGGFLIDKSASERFYSWDKGIEIFKHYPLMGAGFNNIREVSEKLNLNKLYSSDGGNSGSGVDSSLIFILATTGIIGFISWILFLGNIFKEIIVKYIRQKRKTPSIYTAIITGLLLNSFFINSLFYTPILFLFFALIGGFYGFGEGEGEA